MKDYKIVYEVTYYSSQSVNTGGTKTKEHTVYVSANTVEEAISKNLIDNSRILSIETI